MSLITVDQDGKRPVRELLTSLRLLCDSDANLVLLAHQPGITYRDIAEAWGVAPAVIARRLRSALLRMAEAKRDAVRAS